MKERQKIFFSRAAVLFYLIWLILHGWFLYISYRTDDSSKFWPFVPTRVTLRESYDFSEFSFYCGVPLLVFSILKLISSLVSTGSKTEGVPVVRKAETWLTALIREKIRSAELEKELSAFRQTKYDEKTIAELRTDLEKLKQPGAKAWGAFLELKKKYKTEADDRI